MSAMTTPSNESQGQQAGQSGSHWAPASGGVPQQSYSPQYPAQGYPSGAPDSFPAQGAYPAGAYPASAQSGSYPASAQSAAYPPGYGAYGPQGQTGFPPPGMPTTAVVARKDGFGALFDFAFNTFATPSLAKLVYVLAVVLNVLVWLGYSIMLLGNTGSMYMPGTSMLGVLCLLFGWIPALLNIAMMRLILEFFVVQFRSHAHLRDIKDALSKDV